LAAFNGYLAYLAWPTVALGWTLSIMRGGLTSMQRIQEITESAVVAGEEKIGLGGTEPLRSSLRPPTVESVLADPATADPATTSAPSIRFADVTFAYDGRPPALRGVSFSVGAGETVAVVGRTASGGSRSRAVSASAWRSRAPSSAARRSSSSTIPLRRWTRQRRRRSPRSSAPSRRDARSSS